jgi:hypothetical protein
MPAFTLDQIKALSPDTKSITNARKLASASRWPKLGQDKSILWGEVSGSTDYYYVYIDTKNPSQGCCCCPSNKHPCKHLLAILLLESSGHIFPVAPMSASHKDEAETKRYSSGWE